MAEVEKLMGSESPLEIGQKINEIIDNSGGVGLQMFDTILKDHILTYEESKGLALQGTYVYKEALAGSRYGYPDFYNKVVEEFTEATETGTVNGVTVKVHSNGHKFYDIADKEAIDSFFDTMGSAWFYGVDIENERVFLPRNNYFEQVTGSVSEVGEGISAGLPNIEGYAGWFNALTTPQWNGALYQHSEKSVADSNNGGTTAWTIGLDASRSNPIYGNSDTVQPNAVKKLLYICVGNTTNHENMTDVVNQGMEILEQVNQGIESRLNLDITNISNIGKEAIISWGFPDWSTAVSIQQAQIVGATYTFPYDGILVTSFSPHTTTNLQINSVSFPMTYATGTCSFIGNFAGSEGTTFTLDKVYKFSSAYFLKFKGAN